MTNEELIARLYKENTELTDENQVLKERIKSVGYILYNIGAPLNDNVEGFSNEQLKIFIRISKVLNLG